MTHPNSKEAQLQNDEYPFTELQIDNNDVLNTFESRYACGKCNKSRKFFCYTCFVSHPNLEGVIPRIQLPLKIDIIKHQREIDGKSTAAHAAILAPDDVTVYTYPDIPSYDGERVVLIFPSQAALEISQLFIDGLDLEEPKVEQHRSTLLTNLTAAQCYAPPQLKGNMPVTRAVFIDSTWNQSRGIYKDERVRRLPCVVLQSRVSQFWRHQKGSPRWYLATIEAIHQFVVEMHVNAHGVHPEYRGLDESLRTYAGCVSSGERAYRGEYDNLLYFFEYMYKLIHTHYDHDQLYAYTRRMT